MENIKGNNGRNGNKRNNPKLLKKDEEASRLRVCEEEESKEQHIRVSSYSKEEYITLFMLIMLCLLMFSLGYGLAYQKASVYANNAIIEYENQRLEFCNTIERVPLLDNNFRYEDIIIDFEVKNET